MEISLICNRSLVFARDLFASLSTSTIFRPKPRVIIAVAVVNPTNQVPTMPIFSVYLIVWSELSVGDLLHVEVQRAETT